MLIDTHAHLYWEDFQSDLDKVVKRAIDCDITTIINVGVDIELSKKALQQAEQFKNIKAYSTIGIHPHESVNYTSDVSLPTGRHGIHQDIAKLEQIYQTNPIKVVAVGECGLDYLDINEENKKMQKKLFQSQIDLAKKLDLPLIVHCRNAWDDTLTLLGESRGILHCYSGDAGITKKALNLDFIFSFAGNLTYPKNDYLRETAQLLPLEKIVLETDCPFLPPQSIRGKRNEPASVLEIAKLVAQLKGLSLEKVASQTSTNALIMLNLS